MVCGAESLIWVEIKINQNEKQDLISLAERQMQERTENKGTIGGIGLLLCNLYSKS